MSHPPSKTGKVLRRVKRASYLAYPIDGFGRDIPTDRLTCRRGQSYFVVCSAKLCKDQNRSGIRHLRDGSIIAQLYNQVAVWSPSRSKRRNRRSWSRLSMSLGLLKEMNVQTAIERSVLLSSERSIGVETTTREARNTKDSI